MQTLQRRAVGYVSLILFILTIPVGNWVVMNVGTVCPSDGPCLIPVWPGIMSPSAVLLAGLALILRDAVQSLIGKGWTIAAIAAGAFISGWLSEPAIVLGSRMNNERRTLFRPDSLIAAGGLRRTRAENNAVKNRPPLPAGKFDDSSVAEKFSQISAHGRLGGGVGATRINQKNGRFALLIHARRKISH